MSNLAKSLGSKFPKLIQPKDQVIVGVLTTPKRGGKYPLPIGKDARLKEEMVLTARSKGIFMFFFYAECFDKDTDKVYGHTFAVKRNGKGQWKKALFECPDIVYNRLSFRRDEAQAEVQELLDYLQHHPRIKIFNPRFLHKWEVYECLAGSSLTRDLVPETHLFCKKSLAIMLEKYPRLFIKPIDSSIGKGIIMVKRSTDRDGYEYKLACSDAPPENCRSGRELYLHLKQLMDLEHKYLIQKAIDLAQINGRIFDLRLQLQKDGQGAWIMTGVAVRIAAPNKYVTHVPNGGSRADYSKVIRTVFGDSPQKLNSLEKQLMTICKVIPFVLEKRLEMNFGILSIDIGLDQTGLMQIIEVNSKPASFDEDHIRKRHLDNLNQYFIFLSKSKLI